MIARGRVIRERLADADSASRSSRSPCSSPSIVVELVRRRRMMERYALLWLAAAATLLVLAIWKGLLTTLSADVGIKAPANALFAVGFAFVVVLLLSVSLVISRLSDQNKQLAQRVALLDDRLAALEKQNAPEP